MSDSSLGSVHQELQAVRTALIHVAEGMQQFVSGEDLDRRINHERKQRNRLFAALALAATIGLASLAVNAFQLNDLHNRSIANRKSNRQAQVVTTAAVNCILYSLNEHRQANEFAHQAIALDLGKPLKEPPGLQPVPAPELAPSCDVLRKSLSGGAP